MPRSEHDPRKWSWEQPTQRGAVAPLMGKGCGPQTQKGPRRPGLLPAAAEPHRPLTACDAEGRTGLAARPLFLPTGCRLFLRSLSFRAAAVVKVMQ